MNAKKMRGRKFVKEIQGFIAQVVSNLASRKGAFDLSAWQTSNARVIAILSGDGGEGIIVRMMRGRVHRVSQKYIRNVRSLYEIHKLSKHHEG